MRKFMKKLTGNGKKMRIKFLHIGIIVVVSVGFLYTFVSLQNRLENIREDRAECEREYDSKQEEYEKLMRKAEANNSKDYLEKKARDEGYVLENETVFIVTN